MEPIPSSIGGGTCHDLTFGLRSAMRADAREADKRRKYAAQMALHPHLRFSPFAADTAGEIGPAAWATMCHWARSRALLSARRRLPAAADRSAIVALVARAFARAFTLQVNSWVGVG
jgi:hypothetical protein